MKLDSELAKIKGVGPKTAKLLESAGLFTAADLIAFLPRRHEDFSQVLPISEIEPGKVTIKATCESISTRIVRRGMKVTTATLADKSGKVQAVWFNQPYRASQLADKKQEFYFAGEFSFQRGRYQLTNPSVELTKKMPIQAGRILPIYPARHGLKPSLTRKLLNEIRPVITMLPESLPAEIVAREKLMSRSEALLSVHFPEDLDSVDRAKERLSFDELFELILANKLNKIENEKLSSYRIKFNAEKIRNFVASLPFELTDGQRVALWDILRDFEKNTPMNRLLQGDVGSGKTIVAAAAAYQAFLAGYQSAIMAPTEILASQHAEGLSKILEPLGVTVVLLTGSVKGKARSTLYCKIADGEVDVVIGTHALFQKDVKFSHLGFVVIDEQHRFGVKQRQQLLGKGANNETMPHLLAVTATPIPRSLQLTLFGDLDISILKQMPAGRKEIITRIISPNSREALYEKIRAELTKGRQAYVITPLIESGESEKKSAEDEFKRISRKFKEFKVAMLHGKMKPDEKDVIMLKFARHEIDILVATTVVEVGVDVPNATIILIENADQFGLAQLHQLRGRVGRGNEQSYCYLMMSDSSRPTRRLREIEKSNDGFYLSEVDLKLRGPGEIYGTMQHGQLNLKVASLADTRMIARAARMAEWFIESGQELEKFPELCYNVRRYQRLTTLN